MPVKSGPQTPSRNPPALVGLLLLAIVFALHVASSLILPIVLAILISMLLEPIVGQLASYIGRPGAAALVLGLFVLMLFSGAWAAVEPAQNWLANLPSLLESADDSLDRLTRQVDEVRDATESVEALARDPDDRAQPEVEITTRPSLLEIILSRTQSLLGGGVVMIALVYYLLASTSNFLPRVALLIPGVNDKAACIAVYGKIRSDLGRYLLTVALINCLLGVAVALAMASLGVPNPMLWGILAGFLNFIPYVGMVVLATFLTLTTALDATSWQQVLWPTLVYVSLTATEATFITPFALGRRLALDPVGVFLGLLFWGWLWGVAGAMLAVPILMTAKLIADHTSPGGRLASLLGREPSEEKPRKRKRSKALRQATDPVN